MRLILTISMCICMMMIGIMKTHSGYTILTYTKQVEQVVPVTRMNGLIGLMHIPTMMMMTDMMTQPK